MTRHLGLASLAIAALSWALYVAALFSGGLDPPPSALPMLRGTVTTSLALAVVGTMAGAVALARRRQRLAACAGLALGLIYLLLFTGWIFVPLAWLWGGRD